MDCLTHRQSKLLIANIRQIILLRWGEVSKVSFASYIQWEETFDIK